MKCLLFIESQATERDGTYLSLPNVAGETDIQAAIKWNHLHIHRGVGQ